MWSKRKVVTNIKRDLSSNNNNMSKFNIVIKHKPQATYKEKRETNTPKFVHEVRPNNDLCMEEKDLSISQSTSFFTKRYTRVTRN